MILGDLHQADVLTVSFLGKAPWGRVVLDTTVFWEERKGIFLFVCLFVWGLHLAQDLLLALCSRVTLSGTRETI